MYPFENKPTGNSTLWKYSQIYDIEVPESLEDEEFKCFIYQTKLFLCGRQSIIQLNLSTMDFDMQYFFDYELYTDSFGLADMIVTNKNQTLLAFSINGDISVFSMETGTLISRCEGRDG